MREKLKRIDGVRGRFTATFVRFGKKKAFKGPPIITLLFEDIKDSHGNVVTAHLWFTITKEFERLNLAENEGIRVSFEARVKPYIKGYKGHKQYEDVKMVEKDYRLSHPTKVTMYHPGKQNLLF